MYTHFTQDIETVNPFWAAAVGLDAESLGLRRPEFSGKRVFQDGADERWFIKVDLYGRIYPPTQHFQFKLVATRWEDGLLHAAQEALGHVGRIYRTEVKDSPFCFFARRRVDGQVISMVPPHEEMMRCPTAQPRKW